MPRNGGKWSKWTGDRNKAMRWRTVKEAAQYIDGIMPGWRERMKAQGTPVAWMRVIQLFTAKAMYAENTHEDCCVFLGYNGSYDLYYHAGKNGLSNQPFLTARWSNNAADYLYCDAKDASKSPSFDMRLAYGIAVRRGLIT
jgi:hypothetical protein